MITSFLAQNHWNLGCREILEIQTKTYCGVLFCVNDEYCAFGRLDNIPASLRARFRIASETKYVHSQNAAKLYTFKSHLLYCSKVKRLTGKVGR